MLALLVLLACETTTVTGTAGCSLGIPTLSATSAAVGDTIVVTASPLTETWDTAVTVGAARAEVVAVDRSTCDECDDCKDTGECAICGDCDTCDATCATCVETLSFVVPDVTPGVHPVEIVNRHGRSERVELVVTAADTAADTAPADTSAR